MERNPRTPVRPDRIGEGRRIEDQQSRRRDRRKLGVEHVVANQRGLHERENDRAEGSDDEQIRWVMPLQR